MKKKSKPLEWKNTAFEWCIEREYSLFVRNRCVFFHALAGKYIKILNNAKRFCAPQRLIVIYLYGTIKNESTLQRKINEADYQLLTIHIPVDNDDLVAYDTFVSLRNNMKSAGITEDMLRNTAHKCSRAIETGDIDDTDGLYQETIAKLQIIEQWKESKKHLADAQQSAGIAFANFMEPFDFGPDHDAELLNVIRGIYPCGVEANAPDEFGAKMLAMKKLVKAARVEEVTDLINRACGNLIEQQLSFFTPNNQGARIMLDDLKHYISNKIETQGALSTTELMLMIQKPPYGYYECNYYAYILAKALKPVSVAPYMLFTGCSAVGFRNVCDENWLRKPSGIVFLESERTRQMVEALNKIFDTGKEWAKSSFIGALHSICSWCEDNIQTPLGCIDYRWYELLQFDFSRYCYRNEVERYYGWICGNVEQHHKDVRKGKDIVYTKYNDHAKLDLFYKYFYVRGGAVGWLHSPEDFYERIEHYLKSCVCRECGRIIESRFTDGTVYSVDSIEDGKLLKFTKKDIVGINKKMLGRYQEEYFCIPCICEILNTTPDQLYEKIRDFKEQGCELF